MPKRATNNIPLITRSSGMDNNDPNIEGKRLKILRTNNSLLLNISVISTPDLKDETIYQ